MVVFGRFCSLSLPPSLPETKQLICLLPPPLFFSCSQFSQRRFFTTVLNVILLKRKGTGDEGPFTLQQQQYQITIAMQMIQNRSALRPGARSAGRARSVVVRADARPLWAPGVAAPAWLDGSFTGRSRWVCVCVWGEGQKVVCLPHACVACVILVQSLFTGVCRRA
jgi:hypothetical protein